MRKNNVLLSLLALSIALYMSHVSFAEQEAADPFGGVSITQEETSSDDGLETNNTEVNTEAATSEGGDSKVSNVDPDAKKVEDWLKDGLTQNDEKKDDKKDEKKDDKKDEKKEEKKDDDKKDEKKEEKKDDDKKDEKKEEAKTVEYTVVSGDCLSAIAGSQMGDSSRWPEIVELNKDKYPSLVSNPNLIYPGWTLTLPAGSKPQSSGNSGSSSGSYSGTISAKVGEAIDSSGWNSVNPCETMPSRVSSEFGWRTHPCTGERKFHNGIDLPVPSGTRLNAMANGTVTACGFESGGGNYVRIRYDNGYETFYCHLQSFNVKVGERVLCGQQVALSDNTGQWTTGAHLHMEVKVNGERVNPRDVVTSIKNLN